MENKIGKFILELRTERGMTQSDLAEMIPITRQAVSRWEQGKSIPDSSTLIILSEIFDVTINELLNGERNVKNEEQNIEKIALEIIDENILKEKKIKKVTFISILIFLVLIILFLLYYFFATYDSVKIYTIDGKTDKFLSNDGIMILTKQKIYFKLGMLEYDEDIKVDSVNLFYSEGDTEKIIFEDERTDRLIIDFYGYDGYVSYENIDTLINNLYLEIFYDDTSEKIKFNVFLDMTNDKFFFGNKPLVDDGTINGNKTKAVLNETTGYADSIRNAMMDKGEKIGDAYTVVINDKIKFSLFENILRLTITNDTESEYWQYNLLKLNSFLYRKFDDDALIEEMNISDVNDCNSKEKEMFEELKNYINKYILGESN